MSNLIGTAPDQVPVNGMLGDLAFQDIDSVKITDLTYTGTLTGSTGILNIGSGQIYKDASGNVGIGTSSPAADTAVTIYNGGTALSGTGLLVRSGYPGYSGVVANILSLRDKDNTIDTFNIKTDGSLSLNRFSAAGTYTNSLTVNASGNVGIGTSSPTAKFQVGTYLNAGAAGTALISGANVAALNTAGIFTVAATDSIAADIGGSIGFTANGTIAGYPTGSIAGRRENATASNYASYMQFSTSNSAGSVTERMRIDSSGTLILNQGQIKFPSTQVASSDVNTLDDYEEGSWTPTVTSSSGAITSYTAFGYYTKIGRIVSAQFHISITNIGTAAGTYLNVASIPFTGNAGMIFQGTYRENAVNGFMGQVSLGTSQFSLLRYDNSGVAVAGGVYIGNITYHV